MPSCLSSRTKQRLSSKHNIWLIHSIIVWCILSIMLLIMGLVELYKTKTFIIGQCRIKTTDFKFDTGRLYPRWNITVVHHNQTIDDSIISSSGSTSERDAWTAAYKYKINETYSCYHSHDQTSILSWGWKWKKPSELEAYAWLFAGIIVLFMSTALVLLIRHYQAEFRIRQGQQEELELSLRQEEHMQTMTSLEDQPPTSNVAIQWFGRT